MTMLAISVDTEEARRFAARSLGCDFVEWQEGRSKAFSLARGLPQAGVWVVDLAGAAMLERGTKVSVSAPDDDLWGGPIVLECIEP